jgi:hypothetical protein
MAGGVDVAAGLVLADAVIVGGGGVGVNCFITKNAAYSNTNAKAAIMPPMNVKDLNGLDRCGAVRTGLTTVSGSSNRVPQCKQ